MEPVIREALILAAADLPWPEAVAVGGWWNRAFDPEVDLIGVSCADFADAAVTNLALMWLPADVAGAFA